MTSKDMSSNMKMEVSQDTYQGKAATHTKMTNTMTTPMAATTIMICMLMHPVRPWEVT